MSNDPRTQLPLTKTGEYNRPASGFRKRVSREPGAEFPPEKGRYHLYVQWACPWATRTLILRQLKGLQDIISVEFVSYKLDFKTGWVFTAPDSQNGFDRLRQVYEQQEPNYGGRVTVPVFYDKKTKQIVNNESSEIIEFLNTEFNDIIEDKYKNVDLYPAALRADIDRDNEWIYDLINNGVYKSGFAVQEDAYLKHVKLVFEALDRAEAWLAKSKGPFWFGDQLTLTDVRLWVTIIRFDPVYVQHFKCNWGMIRYDYPHLHQWMRHLYWSVPGFKESTNFDDIKWHYTRSHPTINPYGITPIGPKLNVLPL